MKKTLIKRVLPGLIFAFIMLASLIPLSIFSHKSLIARSFSFVFVYALFFICLWEFFNAQKIKWYWVITLTLLFSLTTFIPLKEVTIDWLQIKPENNQTFNGYEYFLNYFSTLSKDPFVIIFSLAISLVFLLIEVFTRTLISISNRFIRFVICLITTWFLAIFLKVFHAAIVYNGQWKYWVTIILVATFVDTFGYIFGSIWGRKFIQRPFTPVISPKKSWEGFIASILLGSAASLTLTFSLGLFNNIGVKILFSLFAPFISVLGDLYFSYIKRINGIKDYSRMLSGHGGLLDRLDSVSFISVLMYLMFLIDLL
ncbi:hypothetical protein E1I18_02335 [Mycoplasmopsis mucosicanis]|uniref:Phosphatidate cytidylyltransferase n=1 Tax=Mycoplasmopsis mucosicanis TaxID=458208 RepID=A0A507SI06_9BACT|nr:phosphatidate cytidylyltransferase [Mycoplasmopsis mucosicanis]TQC51499.1 hypothetical protein E1I18_02335 [Mycoplasmopsis mucosicanis]